MTRTRDEMREYQRTRRARHKAEAAAAGLEKVRALPKDHPFAKADALPIARLPALPSALARAIAPASMVAIGGRPGRGLVPQGYGYAAPPDIAAASTFTKWRADTETMLAALAAKSDAQERRIAALEAAEADRSAGALIIAQALAGLFQSAIRR